MQFLLYLYYFLRSITLRGIYNTFMLLAMERRYEKKFGIHTSSIKGSKSKDYFHYQGAAYLVLNKIFKVLENKTKGYEFVDIGSGKGRVLFMAERFGFDYITGIELDADLLRIARENQNLWAHRRMESHIEFIHANALEARYRNAPTVYFLFNPFGEQVLGRVLDRISSINHKEAIFVYMNPLYPKPFYERKMEVLLTVKTRWYSEAIIFQMKAKQNHDHGF